MRLTTTLRILRAPHLAIGELSDGRAVRLKGRVRSLRGKTLASPVDGRPCVAYRVAIADPKRGWIYENYNRVNFQIEDDTGSAVVDCGSLGIAGWGNLARRVRRVPVSRVAELVPAAGHDAELVLAESILCDGDPVWVYGAPRLEVDAAASAGAAGGGGYREAPHLARIVPDEHGLLVVSNRRLIFPLRWGLLDGPTPAEPAAQPARVRFSFAGLHGFLGVMALVALTLGLPAIVAGGEDWLRDWPSYFVRAGVGLVGLVHGIASMVRAARHPLRGKRLSLLLWGLLSLALPATVFVAHHHLTADRRPPHPAHASRLVHHSQATPLTSSSASACRPRTGAAPC